ncbi:MAG: hypothetical protein AAFZ01_10495 [Pseudomonadota bacterium]
MMTRVLNWLTVLFGLKVASVAAVGSAPSAQSEETKAVPSASAKLLEERLTKGAQADNPRTASGVFVTALQPASVSALPESFVFADAAPTVVASAAHVATKPVAASTGFVTRPIENRAPRPLSRLVEVQKAKSVNVKRSPGQTRQHNRPTNRVVASRTGDAKSSPRRVVWFENRTATPKTMSNVVPFPTSATRFAVAA